MARMHTRKRGRSSSTRPMRTENPDWVPLSKDEIIDAIIRMTKEGYTMSMIGLVLRDQYGVPSIKLATGKSIYQILKEHNLASDIPEDLKFLMKRAIRIHSHLQKNKKDIHNKRNLQRVEAKIRRLVKYYKRSGKLPQDWKYSIETAKLIVG